MRITNYAFPRNPEPCATGLELEEMDDCSSAIDFNYPEIVINIQEAKLHSTAQFMEFLAAVPAFKFISTASAD